MTPLPEPIQHTVDAIYKAIAKRNRGGDSLGVPMSQCANECDRQTWYALRWAAPPETIDGQKQRRFETGSIEEDRLLNDLEAAGVKVERIDPATGKQFKVELADGWLRGKIDGRGENIPEAPRSPHVIECKSHKEKSFKELLKHAPPKGEGLRRSKPDHFAQVQCYMHALTLGRALYIAVNKNDDAIYTERVAYDHTFVTVLEARIRRIVASDRAPPRLHDDPASKAAFACAWCPALTLCHERAFARVNCRTCISAEFLDGAVVRCAETGKVRNYDEQQGGCALHLFLPDLVPAEQIDAGDRWVKYRLENGGEWINGAPAC